MRVIIDIPIFDSATTAWGFAQGEVEIPSLPADGDWLELPFNSEPLKALGLPSPMYVRGSSALNDARTLILLDGVVAENRESAVRIAQILSEEFGFDAEAYG
jgi:hypothetical protein